MKNKNAYPKRRKPVTVKTILPAVVIIFVIVVLISWGVYTFYGLQGRRVFLLHLAGVIGFGLGYGVMSKLDTTKDRIYVRTVIIIAISILAGLLVFTYVGPKWSYVSLFTLAVLTAWFKK